MGKTAIRVEDLGKRYRIGHIVSYDTLQESLTRFFTAPFRRGNAQPESTDNHIWALRHVSLEVEEGEVLGIIGRNGAGKTTLLKILTRVTSPNEGYAELHGRVGSLLEVGTGFHPELTGRENVYLNGAILGMKKKEIERKFDEIVAFSGVEKFVDTPLKRYSSGMHVRLAFAVAAHLEPDILLIDEVLAVGDFEFQQKCFGKMREVGTQGRTVLVVSHQLNNIASLCSRTILLDKGGLVMSGETPSVLDYYISSSTSRQKAGEVAWQDLQTAPGNDHVRLQAVRVLSPDGRVTTELNIAEEITVQVRYWNLRADKRPIVTVFIKGPLDEIVFTASDSSSRYVSGDGEAGRGSLAGLYQSECRIPARLLNEHTYSVDVELPYRIPQEEGHFSRGSLLFFNVHNLLGADNTWVRMPGLVRPDVHWKTEYLEPIKET